MATFRAFDSLHVAASTSYESDSVPVGEHNTCQVQVTVATGALATIYLGQSNDGENWSYGSDFLGGTATGPATVFPTAQTIKGGFVRLKVTGGGSASNVVAVLNLSRQ